MELEEAIELIEMDLDDIVYYLGKQCNFEYGQQVGESILKLIKYIKEESIPRAVVEDMLEKLDKEEKDSQDSISEEEREEYSDANISFILMNIEIRRQVLQEILTKGEKQYAKNKR